MAELYVRYQGVQSETTEYGYPMQGVASFQCLVPEALHGKNPEIALALVRNHPSVSVGDMVTVQLSEKLANGDYRVTGTRTKLNLARKQNDFVLTYRAGVTGEQTTIDANGIPLSVTYDGETQTTSVDIEVPLYEVSCVGIRDTLLVGTPAQLQALWMGKVNSAAWKGIGAGGLRCVAVNVDPHYFSDEVEMYRIEFTFLGREDGWLKWIYWKDPATGNPPTDEPDYTLWSTQVQVYSTADYNTLWPFGTEGTI